MIAERFLSFVETAPVAVRAQATELLARAYLVSSLDDKERADFATALTVMLDDEAPDVRRVIADALAGSDLAPRAVVVGLAADRPEIAARILEHSPLLTLSELIDAVGTGSEPIRLAVARRPGLPAPASAAVAAVCGFTTALALLENHGADIPAFAFEGLLERHGASGAFRRALLERSDLPRIVRLLAELAAFRATSESSGDAGDDVRERLVLDHAAACEAGDVDIFVADLRRLGLLTGGTVLRAVLEDRIAFAGAALGLLGRVPSRKAEQLLTGAGVWSLYRSAGMPDGLRPVFAAALAVPRPVDAHGATVVLAACAASGVPDGHPVFRMLSRMQSDLAREAAREERRRIASARAEAELAAAEAPADAGERAAEPYRAPEIPWTFEKPVVLMPPPAANQSSMRARDHEADMSAVVAGNTGPVQNGTDGAARAA